MSTVIQTFFVDPAAVQNAEYILLTTVDLFVRSKPNTLSNSSGAVAPGISVGICPVENNSPVLAKKSSIVARNGAAGIYLSSDASAVTTFAFPRPIVVSPGKYYGVVVTTEDDGYELWQHKAGDRLLGTNSPSPGLTGSRDGSLYQGLADSSTKPLNGSALKYRVNVAEFTAGTVNLDLVDDAYEFLTFNSRVGAFTGGEFVFANTSAQTGTVTLVANSALVSGASTTFTSFNEEQYLVFKSANTYKVGQIRYITNATALELHDPIGIANTGTATYYAGTVGRVNKVDYVASKLILQGSSANSTAKFAVGQQVQGEISGCTAIIGTIDNLRVDEFTSHIETITGADSQTTPTYNLAYTNGTSYILDGNYQTLVPGVQTKVGTTARALMSRSAEVAEGYLFTNNRSAVVKLNIASSSRFAAPMIDSHNSDIVVKSYEINANTTGTFANTLTYDTEVFSNGIAEAKHIAQKMTFEQDRQAEDLRLFVSAYRPTGTNIQAYAKFLNSADQEPFDDKLWTPLEYKRNGAKYSSVIDQSDVVEYEFGLPTAPETISTIAGTFTTTLANNVVVASGAAAPSGIFAVGDPIKIRSPLFPDNYVVTSVGSTNSTALVINTPVSNTGIVGSGMVIDALRYKSTAFSNKGNTNILRYINSVDSVFDKYNTVQIKLVMVANVSHIVPRVDQMEVVGVSA